MVTSSEREVFRDYEAKIQSSLGKNDLLGAFGHFDEMLNGDFTFPTYYYNVTGMTNYFNFEQGDDGDCDYPDFYGDWLDTDAVRELIHVGDIPYYSFNDTVETYLKTDWMRGVVDMLVSLLEDPSYKVMVYSGQNDVILGPPLTEQFLDRLSWSGASAYSKASKSQWRVPSMTCDPLAGYITNVEAFQFTYAVIRGAGHMVPGDQPARAYDLITRFVNGSMPAEVH
eukprot:FR741788.1.p1 GENE.FR741788.1~~FR741788.1.p1  ORF type:complete len:264 (+),score=46.28 FR741788.1:115-792(+)